MDTKNRLTYVEKDPHSGEYVTHDMHDQAEVLAALLRLPIYNEGSLPPIQEARLRRMRELANRLARALNPEQQETTP